MPAKLTPHLALFEEYGLEPNFLADLQADVAAYNAAFAERSSHVQSRSGDTGDIESKVVEGKRLVKKLAGGFDAGQWRQSAPQNAGCVSHQRTGAVATG